MNNKLQCGVWFLLIGIACLLAAIDYKMAAEYMAGIAGGFALRGFPIFKDTP